MDRQIDAVFEGGGIKGIAHLGAAQAFLDKGYSFRRVAGSSAGAMVAALLGAGYSGAEAFSAIKSISEDDVTKGSHLHHFLGKAVKTVLSYGLYGTQAFENIIASLLKEKGVVTFSDTKSEVKVAVADISEKRVFTFPDDLPFFGIDPKAFPVARAVAMSAAFPGFFEPFTLKDTEGRTHYLVDGGLMANLPLYIFNASPSLFGLKLGKSNQYNKINAFHGYITMLAETALDSEDLECSARALSRGARIFELPTEITDDNGQQKKVSTLEFSLTETERKALYTGGYNAVKGRI
ncbi:MAG: patatin-like phospholipase family protein [Christensenellaceae bacterium]|nr:patatin-like phospholipase family protein [Christensenellaceae bacterium]